MSTNNPARRDARHCPQCGAMGILPLAQPVGDRGEIQDPVMICSVCKDEFRATGMKWLGAFKLGDMSDGQIVPAQILDAWFPEEGDRLVDSTRDVPSLLLDPFGGPDEPD